jgi:hypothetical protein
MSDFPLKRRVPREQETSDPALPFSQREKVPRDAGRMRGYDFAEIVEVVTPHPAAPRPPSPHGRGFLRGVKR